MNPSKAKMPLYLLIALAVLGVLLFAFGFYVKENDSNKNERKQREEELACFLQYSGGVGKAEVRLCYDDAGKVISAAVICEGGDSPTVKAAVTGLLSKTLGIGTNRIYVSSFDKNYLSG